MKNKERIKRLEKQVEELQKHIEILTSITKTFNPEEIEDAEEPKQQPLNGWCVPDHDDDDLKKIIVLFKDDQPIHLLDCEGVPFKFKNREALIYTYRQATPEEIEERLFNSDQCQKYIGADYDCLSYPNDTKKGEFKRFTISPDNYLWINLGCSYNTICDEHGNWAEIREKGNVHVNANEMLDSLKDFLISVSREIGNGRLQKGDLQVSLMDRIKKIEKFLNQ